MRPLVSIILPCYNAEKFLAFSLGSILLQDYTNLEVICINDGSTDRTLEMLEWYRLADTRIRILENPKNLGLIESLNIGLKEVTGDYFARMDADDFSEPDRLSKQVAYLEKNPQLDLISSDSYYFSDQKKLEFAPAIGFLPNAIKFISLFSTPLTHGAAFGRKKLIENGQFFYDRNYLHSEDFELFSRLAWQNVSIGNLPEPLYWLRINPDSVSSKFTSLQIQSHLRITRRNLEEDLGISEHLRESVLKIISNRIDAPLTIADVRTAFAFLEKCYQMTLNRIPYSVYDLREVKRYMKLHSLNIIVQSNKIGFRQKGVKNLPFFLASLGYARLSYLPLVARKVMNYLRFRVRK
jgi:glycosyltransferase involved in cell wall biosynthesis